MSVYSQPWWPNQKLLARPSFCITAIHWPANEPTTMMIRLTNRKFTPRFWYFGSCPEIAGPRYRPVASHAVAIQRVASWVRSEQHTSELESLMRLSYADSYVQQQKH